MVLIIVFMLLKAGLIVAVFMHMLWERLALMYAILVPPLLLLVLLGIGSLEGDHTFFTRGVFFTSLLWIPARSRVPRAALYRAKRIDEMPIDTR